MRTQQRRRRQASRRFLAITCAAGLAVTGIAPSATPAVAKPYDEQLLRLSEILGALHYLRALCGTDDGQTWRRHMQDLVDAEGSSPRRRAVLAQRFNQGYRNYSRTYRSCTITARSALDRFVKDAETVTRKLVEVAKPKGAH